MSPTDFLPHLQWLLQPDRFAYRCSCLLCRNMALPPQIVTQVPGFNSTDASQLYSPFSMQPFYGQSPFQQMPIHPFPPQPYGMMKPLQSPIVQSPSLSYQSPTSAISIPGSGRGSETEIVTKPPPLAKPNSIPTPSKKVEEESRKVQKVRDESLN
jgi:hypothetical protein